MITYGYLLAAIIKDKKMNLLTKKTLSIIGAIFIIVPLYLLWLWIHAWNLGGGYPKSVELYNSYLPEILRGRNTTSLAGLSFCILAIVLNALALDKKTKLFKTFSIIVIIIAGLLAFANFWSMM